MSRLSTTAARRPLLAIAAVGFLLRAGCSLLTEWRPIFPDYYYTDARSMDQAALEIVAAWREDRPAPMPGSLSQRVYGYWLAGLYWVFGNRPLIPKIANAILATCSLAALAAIGTHALGPVAGLGAAALTAAWPSHVFFTSQNFKDAFAMLFLYLFFALAFGAEGSNKSRRINELIGAWAALLAAALFRSYLVLAAGGTAAIAFAVAAMRRPRGARTALACVAFAGVAAIPTFKLLAKGLQNLLEPAQRRSVGDPTYETTIIPTGHERNTSRSYLPLDPKRLTGFRRYRQQSDREWAKNNLGRDIGSQLFADFEFKTWHDVALFVPRGAFYAAFMPLPGLYPIDQKIGRALAAAENSFLLVLALISFWGAWRAGLAAPRATLLLFVVGMAVSSGLLEFDLGSATRHKTLYLPLLFPFAFAALPRRREPGAGRLRVVQVLECGGPGGTGNQVAAICNALDPARFDVTLAYAVRSGAAETYRAQARGAARAYHLPEMTREISPLRDLRALRALYRIFRDERPDVVHAHSSKAGVLARLAAWATGVPRVFYSPHGYGFLQRDRSFLSRCLYRLSEASVSWIGEIIAVSPSEARLAEGLSWGKPVHLVCDPLLGEAPARENANGRSPTIGACGRLTAARSPEAFARLFGRLRAEKPEVRAVWVGGGEQEGRWRSEGVEVTGWLAGDEARRRLAELDVFVHYSAWDALPNAVLEAMAAGLPVVASGAGGCRDAVVHGETGFIAEDEEQLFEHCRRLIDDPGLRRRLGEAGRRRAREQFDARRSWDQLGALYEGRTA